jgi:hypothetical protein
VCELRIFAKFASVWTPAGCKSHSDCRQPDANFIQLAAIRMQISFSRPLAGCKLHPASAMQYKIPSLHAASDQPNEICILLAASQMQILQK